MSINESASVEVTKNSTEILVEDNGDLVATNQHEVCVQPSEESVEVSKKEYAIVGDGLFASVSTDEAPLWLTGLIDSLVDSALLSGLSDYSQLRQDVLSAVDSIDLANNNYVSNVVMNQTIDSSITARIDQLNATLDNKFATITNVNASFATADSALATAITDVTTAYTDDINASAATINSAFSSADSAIASDVAALTTSFEDQEEDVSATADAVSGLQTYVGVDNSNLPTGTGISATIAAQSTAITDLETEVTGPSGHVAQSLSTLEQSSLAYADAIGAAVENKFSYDNTIILNGSYYKSGFGLDSSGITQSTDGTTPQTAFDSEFWVNAERLVFKSPSHPGVEASFNVSGSGIQLSVDNTEATRNTPRGSYNSGTSYIYGDVVSYNGSSFTSLTSQTGVTPVNGANWQLLSAVGATGSTGATGATGPSGSAGATGERGTATLSYSANLGSIATGSVSNASLASYWNASAPASLDAEKTGDTLIVTNTSTSSGWTHIYEFNGSSWVSATALTVNGNQVVTGTLAATALAGGALTSTSTDAHGPLFELDINGIARFRGIEIRDSSNNVIMSSGAAMNYSAIGGTKPPSNANFVNNTSQLTDGASLGATANWGNVSGSGKPADNADVTSSNTAANIFGQGNFATLNQITGSNISTYIESAAIKTAYIDDLQVTTLKIGNNAVTATLSNFTEAATANALLQERQITTTVSGSSVALQAQAYIGIVASGGGGDFVYFNLYRDNTLLKTVTVRAQADRSIYDSSTILYEDTPPAVGTYTYKLTRTGYAANVSDRYLSATEFKR